MKKIALTGVAIMSVWATHAAAITQGGCTEGQDIIKRNTLATAECLPDILEEECKLGNIRT